MKRTTIIFFSICVGIMAYQQELYAYSARVHERITINTIDQNIGNLNKYLNDIGLTNGVKETLNKKQVRKWMEGGSWMEDIGVDILTSHFYDPLTNKGYSVLGVEVGQSAYDSANDLPNYGAWVWARKRLYDGLTQTDKTLREQYLGIAFQALGRAMHLVQDVAVPAHTRNDGHMPWVDSEPYEDYTNKHVKDFVYTSVPFPYWNVSISSQAPKQFWDLDSYKGSTIYASGYIGLAEYTNPNFFSKDTIFKDYPHPSYADTNYPNIDWKHPEIVDAEDGSFDNRIYITKNVGESMNHLAAISYISYDVIKKGYYRYSPFVLDEACHNEYAQKLLPRAVGYSAGLLDYFFRGDISLVSDGDGTSQYAIANASNEDMTGAFSLYYDDANNNRISVATWENLTIAASSQSATVSFPVPTNPAPKEKDKYILVFQGKMGKEEGAVAGRAVRFWREEWDNGLTGNHTWLTTDSELLWQNPANGEAHNDAANGKLVKENIRYAGHYTPRVNQTIIRDAYEHSGGGSTQYCLDEESLAYCVPFDFGTEFPMPITKDTVVRVKIDEMSINENIPYQDCGPTYGGPGGYQGIVLRFDNGANFAFTVPDQVPFNMKLVSYITPGVETSFNISDAFKIVNMEFTEPINLVSVNIVQQLWLLCAPSTTEHRQKMVVDYIRFQER